MRCKSPRSLSVPVTALAALAINLSVVVNRASACDANANAVDAAGWLAETTPGPDQAAPDGNCPRPACLDTVCVTFNPNTPFVRLAGYESFPIFSRAGCFAVTKKPNGSYYHINLDGGSFVYSTSPDGLAWTVGQKALTLGGYWFTDMKCPDPHFIGAGLRGYMYFRGAGSTTSGIGYAATTDGGMTWTPTNAPVLKDADPGFAYDNPSVVEYQGKFLMAYTKACQADGLPPFTLATINLATSSDKLTWTNAAQNPVLSAGVCGEFDEGGVCNPALVVDPDGTTLHLFYTGAGWVNHNTRSCVKIGHAVSTNAGRSWCKDALPVLDRPAAGSLAWDNRQYYVSSYTVEQNSTVIRMYYWAAGTGGQGLGVAESAFPFTDCAPRPGRSTHSNLGRAGDVALSTVQPRALELTPNPTTGRTEIVYHGAMLSGELRLAVYNAAGQRVREVWTGDGLIESSQHEWDGRGESGDPVPAGVYLVRLTGRAGLIASGVVTLVR